MPLADPGLETPERGFQALRLSRRAWGKNGPPRLLFDVAAEFEPGAGQGDDSIESSLHLGR
jgi:hypothetical protein